MCQNQAIKNRESPQIQALEGLTTGETRHYNRHRKFWRFVMDKGVDFLDKIVEVKMDRMLGTKHPKHGFVYEVNYGFIPNTVSGDGEELDAYVLGVDEPVETFVGRVIAVVHRTNDDDDKLVVVEDGKIFSDEEIESAVRFQEQWFEHVLIREKD